MEAHCCLCWLNHDPHFSIPTTNYAKFFSWNWASKCLSSLMSTSCSSKLIITCCRLIFLTNGFKTNRIYRLEIFQQVRKLFPSLSIQIQDGFISDTLPLFPATKHIMETFPSVFSKCYLHGTSSFQKAVSFSISVKTSPSPWRDTLCFCFFLNTYQVACYLQSSVIREKVSKSATLVFLEKKSLESLKPF